MSKSRAKGTRFENDVVSRYLRQVWPYADRAPLRGVRDFGDFTNVNGWLIEAKHRKVWRIPEWVRTIRQKVKDQDPTAPWALVLRQDGRNLPDLVVLPAEQYFHQLRFLVALTQMDWGDQGKAQDLPPTSEPETTG